MTRELLDFLDDVAKAIDPEYMVSAHCDNEAFIEEKIIGLNTDAYLVSFYFIANMYRNKHAKKLPLLHPFTWTFLHELGHLETTDKMDNDIEVRNRLSYAPLTVRDSFEEYSKLHNEKIANKWAVQFVLENKKVIKEVDRIITNMLSEE